MISTLLKQSFNIISEAYLFFRMILHFQPQKEKTDKFHLKIAEQNMKNKFNFKTQKLQKLTTYESVVQFVQNMLLPFALSAKYTWNVDLLLLLFSMKVFFVRDTTHLTRFQIWLQDL